jgi:hypothetical protein
MSVEGEIGLIGLKVVDWIVEVSLVAFPRRSCGKECLLWNGVKRTKIIDFFGVPMFQCHQVLCYIHREHTRV